MIIKVINNIEAQAIVNLLCNRDNPPYVLFLGFTLYKTANLSLHNKYCLQNRIHNEPASGVDLYY